VRIPQVEVSWKNRESVVHAYGFACVCLPTPVELTCEHVCVYMCECVYVRPVFVGVRVCMSVYVWVCLCMSVYV